MNDAEFVEINPAGPGGSGLPYIKHDPCDVPITGAGKPQFYAAYTDPSGTFTAGVWACDAGTLQVTDLHLDEAMFVIKGSVVVTDRHGNSQAFSEGQGFLLKRGFTGIFHMPEATLKYVAQFVR
jgi:uncharacterized protein